MTDLKRMDILGRACLLIVVCAASALIAGHHIKPFLVATERARDFREAVGILSRAEGALAGVDEEIERISSALEACESKLPAEMNLDHFLEQIAALAEGTGVRVERVTPSGVRGNGLFRELEIDVQATGAFPALHDFLDRIETASQLTRVNDLSIAREDAYGGCAASFNLALYFAPGRGGRR